MKIRNNIILVLFIVCFTACPYKEIYKPLNEESANMNGLEVNPVIVFYNCKKGVSTCNAVFKFVNQGNSIRKIQIYSSYMINKRNKLQMEKLYSLGNELSITTTFAISPASDTTLGLMFKDYEKNFGDTIQVGLEISQLKNFVFTYKKTR